MKTTNCDKAKGRSKVTFIEVITVVLVVLLLAVGLAFSYFKFRNNSFENIVKDNAKKVFSAIQVANVTVEEIKTSVSLEEFLESSFTGMFGIGVEPTILSGTAYFKTFSGNESSTVDISSLEDNSWGISDIKESGATFSFVYYHYINESLYSMELTDGIWGQVKVLLDNN